MRAEVAKRAVVEFERIREELQPVIESMGFKALICVVRQRGYTDDVSWGCQEIGIYEDGQTLWGRFYEEGALGDKARKQILVVMDVEDIRAIEYQTFDREAEPD